MNVSHWMFARNYDLQRFSAFMFIVSRIKNWYLFSLSRFPFTRVHHVLFHYTFFSFCSFACYRFKLVYLANLTNASGCVLTCTHMCVGTALIDWLECTYNDLLYWSRFEIGQKHEGRKMRRFRRFEELNKFLSVRYALSYIPFKSNMNVASLPTWQFSDYSVIDWCWWPVMS